MLFHPVGTCTLPVKKYRPADTGSRSSLSHAVLMVAVAALLACVSTACRAEVALVSHSGRRIVGISVKSENEKFIELEIYRGFTMKFPKAAIAKRNNIDRSNSKDRQEFARRSTALKPKDVASALTLIEWAREKKLAVQSRGLLFDLHKRFPNDNRVLAALPVQKASTTFGERERNFLLKQAKQFFSAGGNPDEVLKTLAGQDALPPASVEEWARLCFAEARMPQGLKAGDSTFKRGKLESKLHIELWQKKSPDSQDKQPGQKPAARSEVRWPVLVSLHGGGKDSGHWKLGGPMYLKYFQRHFDRLIFVAPTVMQKNYAEWGGNPAEEYQVREMLKAVNRTWKVDNNRVFLTGYSMGGYGTWHMRGSNTDECGALENGKGRQAQGLCMDSSRKAPGKPSNDSSLLTSVLFRVSGVRHLRSSDRPA